MRRRLLKKKTNRTGVKFGHIYLTSNGTISLRSLLTTQCSSLNFFTMYTFIISNLFRILRLLLFLMYGTVSNVFPKHAVSNLIYHVYCECPTFDKLSKTNFLKSVQFNRHTCGEIVGWNSGSPQKFVTLWIWLYRPSPEHPSFTTETELQQYKRDCKYFPVLQLCSVCGIVSCTFSLSIPSWRSGCFAVITAQNATSADAWCHIQECPALFFWSCIYGGSPALNSFNK